MQVLNDGHLNPNESNSPTQDENDHENFNGYYVPPLPGTGLDKCNVFIKFLPVEVTDTGLYAMFSKFGEITSYKVMVDPITGCSLGYGYGYNYHIFGLINLYFRTADFVDIKLLKKRLGQ